MTEYKNSDKYKIMIVEDEGLIALDLKKRLENMGYEVLKIASSANKAFDFLTKEIKPDIILMDIVLGKKCMDGVEAADLIRVIFNIPVIYITAFCDDITLQRAKETKPLGYITKPFSDLQLKSAIKFALP